MTIAKSAAENLHQPIIVVARIKKNWSWKLTVSPGEKDEQLHSTVVFETNRKHGDYSLNSLALRGICVLPCPC